MKTLLVPLAALTILCATAADCEAGVKASAQKERSPAVAGKFYPDDPAKLAAAVKGYLEDALPPAGGRPIALVVPHAGYVFSGQIAADAFRQASGHDYDLVVILGTNHTTPGFNGVSVYDGTGYRTPLGVAKIDTEVAAALREADPSFAYRPGVHAREHSVEVAVPFVQVALPEARIVTAVVGKPDLDLCTRFGEALAGVLKGRKALVVASSDLSHYPDYEDAVAADRRTLTAIAALDPKAAQAAIRKEMRKPAPGLSTCACGEAPVLAAMTAARALGATRGVVLSYANSGDTAFGRPTRVVGYGAVAYYAGPGKTDTRALRDPEVAGPEAALSAEDKEALLDIARSTIDRYLRSGTVPLARGFSPVLWRKQGAFVTLEKKGQLRGCIGHMAEDAPLGRVVGTMALQAAFQDSRFSPLRLEEWPEVEIEISVLTPFKRVAGYEEIEVGRDGVLMHKGGRRAVFLPQVATEHNWDRDTMLDRLCRKAGLPAGCWREGAEFHTFQADVF